MHQQRNQNHLPSHQEMISHCPPNQKQVAFASFKLLLAPGDDIPLPSSKPAPGDDIPIGISSPGAGLDDGRGMSSPGANNSLKDAKATCFWFGGQWDIISW